MFTLLRRSPAVALARRGGTFARQLCEGVHVDQVCRVWSCKVKDDPTAHQMDIAFEDFLDAAAGIDGCVGASRLVCKEHWDYKLILKFDDAASLQGYMADHHENLTKDFMPAIKALAVDGSVKEQNFVYDDIE